MVVETRLDAMHQMRQAGATLEQVGNCFGISRERVRQLLAERYGSTRVQSLLDTNELCRLADCTLSYINKLKQQGVIRPAKIVGHGRTLWKPETIATLIIYIDRHRCPVCHKTVPSNRQIYCSRECYLEARRYKNLPEEAKRRHNERVARWLAEHTEKARQIQQRKQGRRKAKIALMKYQTTHYEEIRGKRPIPVGTGGEVGSAT